MRIAFREGQDVKKGQVLFELDPRPFQAALKQAEGLLARDRATATNAEEQAKRYADAGREGVRHGRSRTTPREQRRGRRDARRVAASQAAVDQARLNLQYATIRAPDLRAHRAACASARATWCAPPTPRRW